MPALSDDQLRALDHALDQLIPPDPDRGRPGAGEIGVAAWIDAALDALPAIRQMIVESLAALDDIARRRGGGRFNELPRDARAAALDELAAGEHALPFPLVPYAYAGYYQHPRVLESLGLEPRPPHPLGYATVEGDLGLLEPVRRRGRVYREC